MSRQPRKIRKGASRPRHISVRAVRRDPPDLRKLSRALIALAMAQAAAEQEAQAQAEGTVNASTQTSDRSHESPTDASEAPIQTLEPDHD